MTLEPYPTIPPRLNLFPFVKALLQDLYEMKPKVLSAVELDAIGDRDVRGCESKLRQQRVR